MIDFYRVNKVYPGGQRALSDVTFGVDRGEFVYLVGPSGAGKSTLLRLIFRQERPTSGQIVVNGRNVTSIPRRKVPFLRRSIGVVFQDFRLIPRKTVYENIVYLPRILGMRRQQQKRLAYETLRRVGLAHRTKAFPAELSGGEQQRVAIARALISDPEIVLADEPTGNLDPELSGEILSLFRDINVRGTTVMIATHEWHRVDESQRRLLRLEDGELAEDRQAALSAATPSADAAVSAT